MRNVLKLNRRERVEASLRATIENIAGVSTRYLHHGEGDYGIFLLHGVGVSADSWLWNLEQIGSNAWAIAPDLLGYGMTGEGDYTKGAPQEGIVEHLMAMVDHLKISKVMIVGSSFGANIACHLTRRLGSKVDGLVLVGCGPALNTPPLLAAMYEKSFSNGIAAMKQPTIDVCRRRMNNLVHNAASVPEALLMLQLSLYALPGAADRYERRMRGIKEIGSLHRFDITARIQELRLPTLVVWGRHDARGDLEEAKRFASKLPNGEMLIYEECGHLPYLEYPERFNSDIAKFLSTVRQ